MALFSFGGAALSSWIAMRWEPAWIAVGLFALSGVALLALALQPPIEIRETHLTVGRRAILWSEIRRIDQTGWRAPLAVYVTLANEQRILVVHPGDLDSCTGLLRHLRRHSRQALLDGIPYRQFWGEPALPAAPPEPKQLPPARYPLLRPEDEDEVDRMFQRLKTVGRIDQRTSDDK